MHLTLLNKRVICAANSVKQDIHLLYTINITYILFWQIVWIWTPIWDNMWFNFCHKFSRFGLIRIQFSFGAFLLHICEWQSTKKQNFKLTLIVFFVFFKKYFLNKDNFCFLHKRNLFLGMWHPDPSKTSDEMNNCLPRFATENHNDL